MSVLAAFEFAKQGKLNDVNWNVLNAQSSNAIYPFNESREHETMNKKKHASLHRGFFC